MMYKRIFAHHEYMHKEGINYTDLYFFYISVFLPIPYCTLCVISEQLIDIQENVEALPGETVKKASDIPETDIAKEEQVEIEMEDATVSPTVPG